MCAIRLMLALSAVFDWNVAQFNISTSLLDWRLQEEVHMYPPKEMHVPKVRVLKLVNSLLVLRQEPIAWNTTLNAALEALSFESVQTDACLYSDR